MRKRKLQNMTTDQLVKRLSYLKSKQKPNEKEPSNQMKYINYHMKRLRNE